METFLVEAYLPVTGELASVEDRARAVAQGGVKYVRSIFTPQDELCLHVFESPSYETLARAIAVAGFDEVRITKATEFPDERRRQ